MLCGNHYRIPVVIADPAKLLDAYSIHEWVINFNISLTIYLTGILRILNTAEKPHDGDLSETYE